MKTQSTYLNKTLSILLCLGLIMTSCSDDDDSEPQTDQQTQQESADTFPTPSDADGTCVAVKSTSITDTPIGPITTIIGTAVAVFSDDGFNSFISAGTVSCNTSELTLNTNNSYVFDQITQTNPTGIDYNGDVMWSVTGGNGIASFDHNANNIGFPTAGAITSSDQIDIASGYTLTCESVSGADSVLFLIGGTTKTLAGNATECTFTAAELADVDTGTNIAQVAAYVLAPTDFGDTRIYFVNETVQSKTVTVQ